MIGLLASPEVLYSRKEDRLLALVPQRWRWQPDSSLVLGLRTGFCGSLTTFSGWMLQASRSAVPLDRLHKAITALGAQVVSQLCDGGDLSWVSAIFALLVGTELACVSYTLGEHTVLALDASREPVSQRPQLMLGNATQVR